MDKWLQFLAEQDASIDRPGAGANSGAFDAAAMAEGFVAPLTDLGLLAFAGEDAAHFLHGQVTNDVEHLGTGEARLAGYCSPKGRLLATMLMWKTGDAVLLQLPRDILPAVQKRLQMYVLRAKVKITDLSGEYALLGLGGNKVRDALQAWFPELPVTPYAKIDNDAGTLVRVADAGNMPRYLWCMPVDGAIATWPSFAKNLQPLSAAAWRLSEIRAGLPRIVQETQDKFVPQMINFEAVGGVNFKKGCYPGQEIVARSQYLGKLKRRMMPATVEGDARPGMEVFSEADPEQPCGMIVNAECAGGQSEVLVELKTAELGKAIHLGAIGGPLLSFQPLPYALPDTD